jgi:anti-sigma factor RsiW
VTARVLHLDSDQHLAAQILLPWYANATLDEDERVRFEAHLGECPRCQADVEFQRRLQAVPAAVPADAADRGWLALRARLEAKPAADTPRATGARGWVVRWLPLTLGLQMVLALFWPPPGWRRRGRPSTALSEPRRAPRPRTRSSSFARTPPRVPSARRCAPPTRESSAARP